MAAITLSRPQHAGASPSARGAHSATQVGNLMVVFGGQYFYRGKFFYLGDLWALDVDAAPNKWHQPKCGGRGKPSARYGHTGTMSAAGDWNVYVFGGKSENGITCNDLWMLDVERWSWELLTSTSQPPSPRLGHSAVSVGNRLLVFGGWDGRVCPQDGLWLYDRDTYSWMRPRVTGVPATPRQGHTCVFDPPNSRMIIFGGVTYDESTGTPQHLKDVRELDLRTMAWSRASAGGDAPSPRYWMGSAQVSNCLVIFGGWRGAEEFTGKPVVPHEDETSITIQHTPGMGFGAQAAPGTTIRVPYAAHPDLYLYDVDSREFVRPKVAGKLPGYRYGASAVTSGTSVYLFGGWEDGRALSEVLHLDLSPLAQTESV